LRCREGGREGGKEGGRGVQWWRGGGGGGEEEGREESSQELEHGRQTESIDKMDFSGRERLRRHFMCMLG
jgi:hypothetical protein